MRSVRSTTRISSSSPVAPRRTSRTPSSASVLKLLDRKSTRLNSSHSQNSYAAFCLKKKQLWRQGGDVAEAVDQGEAELDRLRRPIRLPRRVPVREHEQHARRAVPPVPQPVDRIEAE